MLYSLRPSTTSGNSGAEQLNIKVSVPVENYSSDGAETPIAKIQVKQPKKEVIVEEIPDIKNDKISDTTEENKPLEVAEEPVKSENVIKETPVEIIEETANIKEELVEEIKEEIIQESAEIESENIEEIPVETETETKEEIALKSITEEIVEVDTTEVLGGFEEARKVLKSVYDKVLNEAFKPSLNDATVDMLAYIGARAKLYNKGQEFLKAFGVDVSRFADRYNDVNYLPIAFKISVWADKNKGLDCTIDILNGLLQTLFAFNVGKSESEIVSIVKDSILGIIEYLEREGINSGF